MALRMRKQRRGTESVAQLGGRELSPVGDLDAGKSKDERERQGLYGTDIRAQLGGRELYPMGELDAGKPKDERERQGLYGTVGQNNDGQYQDAPVEMATDNNSPEG